MITEITIEADLLDLLNEPGYLCEAVDEKVRGRRLLWVNRTEEVGVILGNNGVIYEIPADVEVVEKRVLGIFTLLEALQMIYLGKEVI